MSPDYLCRSVRVTYDITKNVTIHPCILEIDEWIDPFIYTHPSIYANVYTDGW